MSRKPSRLQGILILTNNLKKNKKKQSFNGVYLRKGQPSGQIRYKDWQARKIWQHIVRHAITKDNTYYAIAELERALDADSLEPSLRARVNNSIRGSVRRSA